MGCYLAPLGEVGSVGGEGLGSYSGARTLVSSGPSRTLNTSEKGHITDCSYKAEQEATAQHSKARNSSSGGAASGVHVLHRARAALRSNSPPCLAHPHPLSSICPPQSSLAFHTHHLPSARPGAHRHVQGQRACSLHFPGPFPAPGAWGRSSSSSGGRPPLLPALPLLIFSGQGPQGWARSIRDRVTAMAGGCWPQGQAGCSGGNRPAQAEPARCRTGTRAAQARPAS